MMFPVGASHRSDTAGWKVLIVPRPSPALRNCRDPFKRPVECESMSAGGFEVAEPMLAKSAHRARSSDVLRCEMRNTEPLSRARQRCLLGEWIIQFTWRQNLGGSAQHRRPVEKSTGGRRDLTQTLRPGIRRGLTGGWTLTHNSKLNSRASRSHRKPPGHPDYVERYAS